VDRAVIAALAWQKLLCSKFVLEAYTFADVRESPARHLFHVATLTIRNKATGESKTVSGPATAHCRATGHGVGPGGVC
jgi:hypothetical protein